jgi:hypothetical protein
VQAVAEVGAVAEVAEVQAVAEVAAMQAVAEGRRIRLGILPGRRRCYVSWPGQCRRQRIVTDAAQLYSVQIMARVGVPGQTRRVKA